MKDIIFKRIGIVRSPFLKPAGIPIQPPGAIGAGGTIEIFPEYADGLKDLEGFSHIIVLYLFHRADGYELCVKPFLEDDIHGVFAVRAPKRPNPIGMSIVKLNKRTGNLLSIDNPDMIDGTPVLDIKPYIPDFDAYPDAVAGWQEKHKGKVRKHKSDERFK